MKSLSLKPIRQIRSLVRRQKPEEVFARELSGLSSAADIQITDEFIRVGERKIDRVCRNCKYSRGEDYETAVCKRLLWWTSTTPKDKNCGHFELTKALKKEIEFILKYCSKKV